MSAAHASQRVVGHADAQSMQQRPTQIPMPLYGYPTLGHVEPRVELKGSATVAACTGAPQLPKKRRGRPPYQRGSKRSALDAFGDDALCTRDQIGHMAAALEAHLTTRQLKETGQLAALKELELVVAKDMQKQIDSAWDKGVVHGEWLKEGQCRQLASVAADVASLRKQNFQLKYEHLTLQQQLSLALARVEELSQSASPVLPPAPPPSSELSLEELLQHLPDEHDSATGIATEEDEALRRALSDITNLL